MNYVISFALFLCSTLLSTGKPPLTAELLEPSKPIVLDAKNSALLVEVAAALKEKQAIEASSKKTPSAKPDFTRLRELEAIIAKGSNLKQGITLTLRLTNTSKEAITINYGGDTSTNTLTITGPGALNLKFNGMMTREYRMGKPTTIAPGKFADFTIAELNYDKRDSSRWLLTKPGNYAVQLKFSTRLDREKIDLSTKKVTLTVKE